MGLNILDYVTRQYDPVLGRFLNIDPAAELMKFYSPYTYSFDNPIRFHDKDGNLPEQGTVDPPDVKKIQSGPQVDMTNAPAGSSTNAAGYPRNGPWFWRQMLSEHPEMFSQENAAEIRSGRAPRIDDKWIDFNPSHSAYKGDKLIHHHIDQGKMATGVPETVHNKFRSQLHTNTGGRPRGGGSGLGMALGFAGSIGLVLDLTSNDPHAVNMMLSAGRELNTLYFDINSDQYFEVTKRGKEAGPDGKEREFSEYTTYQSYFYDEDAGKYRGSGASKTYRSTKVGSIAEAYEYLKG